MPARTLDDQLLAELFAQGEELWRRFVQRRGREFHPFVPADYPGAHRALAALRGSADSLLEFGSGVGVITILADLLGYEAAGIEIDPWLVDEARALAERFDAEPQFACGTFIPEGFVEDVGLVTADFMVLADGPAGYDELRADIDEFDLIYAFPWPEEEFLYFDLVKRCASPHARFLTFSGTEGYRVFPARGGEGVELH